VAVILPEPVLISACAGNTTPSDKEIIFPGSMLPMPYGSGSVAQPASKIANMATTILILPSRMFKQIQHYSQPQCSPISFLSRIFAMTRRCE
jgi:hypothetical protein